MNAERMNMANATAKIEGSKEARPPGGFPLASAPKKIFICSPYQPTANDPPCRKAQLEANIQRAKTACRILATMGVLPLAPHLYFTQFLKDEDAQERATGIRFGMQWLEAADEVWVFGETISEGMAAEIKRAHELQKGYSFYSETDTEVAAKLIDYYYKKYLGTPIDAMNHAMVRIRGSYARAIMFKDYPNEIYVARKESPMIVGVENGESLVASDVPAILKYTRNVYYIGNLEIGRLEKGKATFFNLDGDEIEKKLTEIQWDAEAAEKAGFEHFMMKEIHEQPKAVEDTINSVVKEGCIDLSEVGLEDEDIRRISQVRIVACGSAYHVGVAAQYVIEDLANIPVRVEIASEFRYRKLILDKDELVVIISQSGETADSLAALREVKRQGIRTLAIVNVVGSSIAREADNVFYTLAGPEIAVATTKAYSTQLIASYALAIQFAKVRENISEEKYHALIEEMLTLPEKIIKILEDKERLQWFSAKQINAKDVFFIGRGIDYAISLEGSLKMKEISYIHSEAYVAGELKHGTISLIEEGTFVIGVLTQNDLYEKTVSNMVKCKSRGTYLMGLATYGHYSIEDTADFVTYIPPDGCAFRYVFGGDSVAADGVLCVGG